MTQHSKLLIGSAVIVTVITVAAVTVSLAAVLAESTPVNRQTCIQRVRSELSAERDLYRSHLFGSRTTGVGGDRIPGILESPGRLSSELVDPLVRSYETLKCRSRLICDVMFDSLASPPGQTTVHTLGCEPVTAERYPECLLAGQTGPGTSSTTYDSERLFADCTDLVTRSLEFERASLLLITAYDAGYRSGLQRGGILDWLQTDVQTLTLLPIRDLVSFLGRLHEIPCFIGQCDSGPPPFQP